MRFFDINSLTLYLFFMFNPFRNYRNLRRAQQIISAAARYGFDELIGQLRLFRLLRLRESTLRSEKHQHKSRAVRFREMLEQLGPFFIKLGQVMSTRPDILPPDIVAELSHLQDAVAPTPWDAMQQKLRHVVGDYFEKNFAEFNPHPIASASIAQVYKARLKSGEEVAVKIIRPGTHETFRDDFNVLSFLAHWIDDHIDEARHWDLPRLLDQIKSSVNHELDMQHEGRNADIFRSNFADDESVYVPRIFWDCTRRNILVMEYIEGRRLQEFFHEDVDLETRRTLARNGANIVLSQMFEHGFFQADPHPGNAFVMDGNVICFLDFGMFGRLDRYSLEILGRVLHAIVRKDIDRIMKAARDLDVLPREANLSEIRVACLDLIEQYYGIPLKQIDVQRMLNDIIRLVSYYRIGVRHDFLFLLKALGTIENSGNKLDPDFDMLAHLRPFVHKLVTRQFTPRDLLDKSQRFAEDWAQLTRETPDHLIEILRNIRDGRLKLEFEHIGLDKPVNRLDRMADKIVLGMVVGALTIASALLSHAGIGPKIVGFPLFGGISFFIALIFSLFIIIHILRSPRE